MDAARTTLTPASLRRGKKIRILVFGVWEKESAASELRTVGPLSLLPRREFDVTYISTLKAIFSLFLVPDIIIAPRSPLSRIVRERLMDFARVMKIPVIVDVDDLIIDMPPSHVKHSEYRGVKDGIVRHWRDADMLTVTCKPLKEELEKYNGKTRIFPNFIDEKIWAGAAPAYEMREVHSDDRLVIGYAGSASHDYDFKYVIPAIKEILARYKGKIAFKSIGYMPPFAKEISGYEYMSPVRSYKKYAGRLNSCGFDIMLAPLEDNPFNRCKSDIKFLEYSICGYPGIYSNVGPYRDSVANGETGILVGNTTEEWIRAMERLINDRRLRITLAANAYKYVKDKCLLQSGRQERIEFYKEVTSASGHETRNRVSIGGILAYGPYAVYDTICKWAYLAKEDYKMNKDPFKLLVKRISCIIKGIGRAGEDAYASPRSSVRYAGRVTLGKGAVLEPKARLVANGEGASISIGDYTTIYPYALLKTNGGRIEIGEASSVNDYCVLYGSGGITIGPDVHIAAHVVIIASEHDYSKLGSNDFSKDVGGRGVKIEKSVWVGARAVILDGVTIGTGSVIGAGAVVTEDIPPYSIAVGVPAKVIKERPVK